jgi:manganese efflux pump family protein
MGIAALIAWILTAGGGFFMLAKWVGGGGHRGQGTKLPPAVIFSHFLLAAAGLVLWIIYLTIDSDPLGWAALIALVPVAVLGFVMLVRWIPTYRGSHAAVGAGGPGNRSDQDVPERSFPVAVVAGHGVLAVATVILVLLAMTGVGAS